MNALYLHTSCYKTRHRFVSLNQAYAFRIQNKRAPNIDKPFNIERKIEQCLGILLSKGRWRTIILTEIFCSLTQSSETENYGYLIRP